MENSLFGGRTLAGSLVLEKVISSLPSTHVVVLVNGGDLAMVMEFYFHCFYITIFLSFQKLPRLLQPAIKIAHQLLL